MKSFSLLVGAFLVAIGCAAHATVIPPFDTQIYLADSGYTRFLPLMGDPTSGQSIPFVDGATQFAGSSALLGDNFMVSTDSSQGTGGSLLLTISIFTANHTNMFPQGVTFPDTTPAENLVWVVGGQLADRDGTINDLLPFFPSNPKLYITETLSVFNVAGALSQKVSFSTPSNNADFFVSCCSGTPEDIGRLEVTLNVIPTPEPSSITLLSLGTLCVAAFGWRHRRLGLSMS